MITEKQEFDRFRLSLIMSQISMERSFWIIMLIIIAIICGTGITLLSPAYIEINYQIIMIVLVYGITLYNMVISWKELPNWKELTWFDFIIISGVSVQICHTIYVYAIVWCIIGLITEDSGLLQPMQTKEIWLILLIFGCTYIIPPNLLYFAYLKGTIRYSNKEEELFEQKQNEYLEQKSKEASKL